jgi:hypothetical protein
MLNGKTRVLKRFGILWFDRSERKEKASVTLSFVANSLRNDVLRIRVI